MKKPTAALLALLFILTLCFPAFAGDDASETDVLADLSVYYDFEHRPLDEIMSLFRTEYGLDENNFAMAYYATGTGDSYGFQVDSYRDAGYTYMVPLNILLYDRENAGEIRSDDYVGTYYIPYLHKYTLTDSDVPMAKTMWKDLGDYREYREIITQFSNQSYTEEYYSENVFNVRYLMNVLWHLYENPKDYEEMLQIMGEANPGDAFDMHLENKYNVVHKYSGEDGIYNDMGIIYTSEPFILVVLSQNVGHAEEMLGSLSELLAEYTEYLTARKAQGLPAYTPEAPVEASPDEAASTVVSDTVPEKSKQEEEGPVPVWVLIVVVILAIALAVFAYMKGLVNGAKLERNRAKQTAWLKKKKQKTPDPK